jgi:hypothetical protein
VTAVTTRRRDRVLGGVLFITEMRAASTHIPIVPTHHQESGW